MLSFQQFVSEASREITVLFDHEGLGKEISVAAINGVRLVVGFYPAASGGPPSARSLEHDMYTMKIKTKVTKKDLPSMEDPHAIAPPPGEDPSVKAIIKAINFAVFKWDLPIIVFDGLFLNPQMWKSYRTAFQHVIPAIKSSRQVFHVGGKHEKYFIIKPGHGLAELAKEWLKRHKLGDMQEV